MKTNITLPKDVAAAIAHYVSLADSKSEAFTDILSMGYEGWRANTILRHFEGNHDELMEALICGYQVAKTPEEQVREMYAKLDDEGEYTVGVKDGIIDTLNTLGIKIAGINA